MCEDDEAEGRLPSITSQFVSRKPGDLPDVRPYCAENFIFLGQVVEKSRDCVFLIEYSVRSAKATVGSLTDRFDPPPSVAWTDLGPLVLATAGRVLLGLWSSARVCSSHSERELENRCEQCFHE